MKIYIFVDMEGISGISGSEFITPTGRYYETGRRLYTMDANACIRGCLAAGATEIVVRDGHSSGTHMIYEELHPAAALIQGDSGGVRFPELAGAAAMILLGYHAMAGVSGALLEHTYSSASIQSILLNDEPVGEFAIDAAIAAEHGVPVIMTSGDDKLCREAATWLPEVVTCQVKKGLSCQGAAMLSMERAHRLIEEKTASAIGLIGRIPLRRVAAPVVMRREAVERCGVSRPHPQVKIIDARTCEITAASVGEALSLW